MGVGLLHSGLFVLIRGTPLILAVGLPLAGLFSAVSVVLLSNTIHALLALIGVFICFVTIYLVQGIEYLAYVFLIVYVGAVAILFLFVIMLLNVKALSRHTSVVKHTTQVMAVFFGALLFWRLFTTLRVDSSVLAFMAQGLASSEASSLEGFMYAVNNAADIAAFSALFSTESALFLVILMVLLVAMLGAIILATKSMEAENSHTHRMEIASGVGGFFPVSVTYALFLHIPY